MKERNTLPLQFITQGRRRLIGVAAEKVMDEIMFTSGSRGDEDLLMRDFF